VRVNCASLSESMVESELFGHERGAFTGAVADREGYFAAAHGGTLLLDEVGELSLQVQAKLLRVLETGEIVRVGSTQPRRVDVRLVAATHRDLPALVARGEFREDLYFRLDGLRVTIPSLRERPSEILPLAQLFLRRSARQLGRPGAFILGDAAASLLERHAWPGNVRELRNAIARAVALCQGGVIQPEHFAFGVARASSSPVAPEAAAPAVPTGDAGDMRGELRAFEHARILAALARAGGNQTRAAGLLGVSRRTLTNKLNAYGIERPRKRTASGVRLASGG
jgi:DNA-binding NtrC family response regulator